MKWNERAARVVRHRLVSVWIVAGLLSMVWALPGAHPTRAHTSIVVDAVTTDWCAPSFLGTLGADTRLSLTPGMGCPQGNEVLWEDGTGDTQGWMTGGVPDTEIDLTYWATTADATFVYFLVALGPYANVNTPPHVQIAIDVDLGTSGNPVWYDPLATGTQLLGAMVGILPDYLITTDVLNGSATVWHAPSSSGAWISNATVPLAWSGAGTPGVIELAVPWAAFSGGPFLGPGTDTYITVMSAHGMPSGLPGGLSDAPMTAEDDLMSEPSAGAYTTTQDSCPCGAGATACECNNASADAFTWITYQSPTPVGVHHLDAQTSGIALAIPATAFLVISAITWWQRRRRR